MGEMKGSTFLAKALCLRFPELRACTENLPPVLQGLETFSLIIQILQDRKQERIAPVTILSCREPSSLLTLGVHEQQSHTGLQREVKQEAASMDGLYHQPYNVDPGLQHEWSLGGIEELFMESDELQLKPDSLRQAYEPFESPPVDEKPSLCFQSMGSDLDLNISSKEVLESSTLCVQTGNTFFEEDTSLGTRPSQYIEANTIPFTLDNNVNDATFEASTIEDSLGFTDLCLPRESAFIRSVSQYFAEGISDTSENTNSGVETRIINGPLEDRSCLKAKCGYSSTPIYKESGRPVKVEVQEEQSTVRMPVKVRKLSILSKVIRRKRNTVRVAARWLKDKKLFDAWKLRFMGIEGARYSYQELGAVHKVQSSVVDEISGTTDKVQASVVAEVSGTTHMGQPFVLVEVSKCTCPELGMATKLQTSVIAKANLQPVIKKRHTVHNIIRDTNVILALPAAFSEQDKCHLKFEELKHPLSSSKSDKRYVLKQSKHGRVAGNIGDCQAMACLEKGLPPHSGHWCESGNYLIQSERINLNQWPKGKRTSASYESRGTIIENNLTQVDHFKSLGNSEHTGDGGGLEGIMCEKMDIQVCEVQGAHPLNPPADPHSYCHETQKQRMRGAMRDSDINQEDMKRCHRSDGKHWRCSRLRRDGAIYCDHHVFTQRMLYEKRRAKNAVMAKSSDSCTAQGL